MALEPGALARWRAHREEVMGVDNAAAVVDPFHTVDWDKLVTTEDLDPIHVAIEQLRADNKELRAEIKELRRDLIRVTGAQFFALIAAVAALVGLD